MSGRARIGLVFLTGVLIVVPVRTCDEYITDHWFRKVDCGVTEVPAGISSTTAIVSLEGNHISRLRSGAFKNLLHCGVITLQENSISVIDNGAFTGLGNLQTLDLGNNQITEIKSGTFKGLKMLTRLVLQYNKISSVEVGAFADLKELDYIELEWNQLTTLSRDAFAPGNKLPDILLNGNPFVCDAKVCWLQEAQNKKWMDLVHPTCSNYPETSLDEAELDCNEV